MKTDLLDLSFSEIKTLMEGLGEPNYRASQVFDWIHTKKIREISKMTNLSKDLRTRLEQVSYISSLKLIKHQKDRLDSTEKFLFAFEDGQLTETVLMKYRHGNSLCISSQVGCRMACDFCASTLNGLSRNIRAKEMLAQVYEVERSLGENIHSIVIMGMGEPFDNFEEVKSFLNKITDKKARNLGERRITVSTCGLAKEIKEFADLDKQVNLAISLHQADQRKREQIMPIAKKYSLDQLKEACHYYIKKTNRRITFEYALIEGENDSKEDADKIIDFSKGMICHINLLAINPIDEKNHRATGLRTREEFKSYLEARGLKVTLRRTLGQEIDAACGQLRNRQELNK